MISFIRHDPTVLVPMVALCLIMVMLTNSLLRFARRCRSPQD